MGKNDVIFSYDVDTGKIVGKTQFNDDGTIDRYTGINKNGYSHDKYSSSKTYSEQGKGDIYNRPFGEDKGREWKDRDGVFGKNNK